MYIVHAAASPLGPIACRKAHGEAFGLTEKHQKVEVAHHFGSRQAVMYICESPLDSKISANTPPIELKFGMRILDVIIRNRREQIFDIGRHLGKKSKKPFLYDEF